MGIERCLLAGVVTAAAAALGGCSGDVGAASDDGRLQVGTTVAPITSIAANIGGDRVDITGIVPEGTNSHTFEPKPSVAELLSTADVVYINGLSLEDPTKELAEENLKDGAAIVELGTQAIPEGDYLYDFSFPRSGGVPNPHLWTDPLLARRYARIISEDLATRDPGNAGYYRSNYTRFSAQIDRLDKAMRASFATIPEAKRRLLTYHDAYAYFARDYGWTVIGAIQVENFEDPTPREVVDLIDQVREERVPAIFGSEVFPSPVLEQIGTETGVRYVDVLRDDDLPGAPGDPEHSWVGLMRFDFVTMTEAMGGDAAALKAFTPGGVAPDTADYPQ
jgi:ABC-type Zn uptake system ZnuABC Zn-binding protein ZnuA